MIRALICGPSSKICPNPVLPFTILIVFLVVCWCAVLALLHLTSGQRARVFCCRIGNFPPRLSFDIIVNVVNICFFGLLCTLFLIISTAFLHSSLSCCKLNIVVFSINYNFVKMSTFKFTEPWWPTKLLLIYLLSIFSW